ncbi:MAG: hypothetical protein AABY22_36555 [Nanoarchaeota archaeon]
MENYINRTLLFLLTFCLVLFLFIVGLKHSDEVKNEYYANTCKRLMDDRNSEVHNISYTESTNGISVNKIIITCISVANHPDGSFITREYRTFEINR